MGLIVRLPYTFNMKNVLDANLFSIFICFVFLCVLFYANFSCCFRSFRCKSEPCKYQDEYCDTDSDCCDGLECGGDNYCHGAFQKCRLIFEAPKYETSFEMTPPLNQALFRKRTVYPNQ